MNKLYRSSNGRVTIVPFFRKPRAAASKEVLSVSFELSPDTVDNWNLPCMEIEELKEIIVQIEKDMSEGDPPKGDDDHQGQR